MTTDEHHQNESFSAQIGAILFLTAIFFINFTGRVLLAPLLPAIEGEVGFGHGEAGSLFLLISLGYFVTMIGSGFVSSRLFHRWVIIISTIAVGLAFLLVGLSPSLMMMRISFFILGLGAGIYLPSGVASVTSLVQPRDWGKAMAVHELAPNLGLILAPFLAEFTLRWSSWRTIFFLFSGLSLLTGVIYALYSRGGRFLGQAPNVTNIKVLARQGPFWIMIVLFGLGVGGSMGIYTMLPLCLSTEAGLTRGWANTLVALSRISGLFIAFISGWASDRFGPRRAMTAILLASGVSTILLGFTNGIWLVIIIFLQAAVAASFFPPGFAALSLIGQANERNLVVSLTVPLGFVLGGGAIPTMIGHLGETHSFALGLIISGGLILSALFLIPLLRFRNQRD